jgi:hypothetical protein
MIFSVATSAFSSCFEISKSWILTTASSVSAMRWEYDILPVRELYFSLLHESKMIIKIDNKVLIKKLIHLKHSIK